MPPEIREARIVSGENILEKNIFFHREGSDMVKIIREAAKTKDEAERQKVITSQVGQNYDQFEDIVIGELDGQPGTDVALLGRSAVHILSTDGDLRSFTPFEFEIRKVKVGWFETENPRNGFNHVQAVDLDNDGRTEFILSGPTDGLAVFDLNGKLLWKYGAIELDVSKALSSETKEPMVDSVTAGDMDRDGKAEVFVLMFDEGLRAFDSAGNVKWVQPLGEDWSDLKVVDLTGAGMPALLEKDGRKIVFRDVDGNIFQTTEISDFYGDLTFCSNSDEKKPQLIDEHDGRFKVLNLNGLKILEGNAPLSEIKLEKASPGSGRIKEILDHPKAAWVKLRSDQPKYLAVTGHFIGLGRSLFYLYDAKGNLIYEELLPGEASSVAALRGSGPGENGTESILVGGEKTVWRYNFK
ncbi:MAG TPA: VCBS repeat-containing protein [Pyrinomonadaceae bacterium]|jgi:hypothetical protein|nr:VCBS repeat-containing protein [Pyrinomonadaceae bacterium]